MEAVKISNLRDLIKFLNENKLKKKDIVYLNKDEGSYVLIYEVNGKEKGI